MARLIVPVVLRPRRWLGLPGLVAASSRDQEYLALLAFREDRPGGRLLEIVVVRDPERRGLGGYVCASGWAGAARLAGLRGLVEELGRAVPLDKAHVPARETVFLIGSPETARIIAHPAECSDALLSYLRGWANYLAIHGDVGLGLLRRRVEELGLILGYEYARTP